MAIELYLKEWHKEILNSMGSLNLSHNDHRDFKIEYSENVSVYDMALAVYFDKNYEDCTIPAISMRGRIVQELLFQMLDNVTEAHAIHIIHFLNRKLGKKIGDENA